MVKKAFMLFVKIYDGIEARVLVASLGVTVLLIFAQIVMRSVFNASLTWSEELARYLFIWQTWMGVSVGLRDKKHIKVELIFNYLKGKKAILLHIVGGLVCLVMCGILVKYGWYIVQNSYTRGTISAALRMPLWIVYMAIPVSCLATALRYIAEIAVQLNLLVMGDEEKDEAPQAIAQP